MFFTERIEDREEFKSSVMRRRKTMILARTVYLAARMVAEWNEFLWL